MTQTLSWTETPPIKNPLKTTSNENSEHIIHTAFLQQPVDAIKKAALIAATDKAVELLPCNIEDDSRYLLFEWDANESCLTVVVTDDKKENDSRHIVQCTLSSLATEMKQLKKQPDARWVEGADELSNNVRETIHNHLTTCAGFMQYSLIALFHSESRQNTRLI